MAKKTFRRSLRIGGVLIKSPRFKLKSDADRWYNEKSREKQFLREGVHMPMDERTTLNQYFPKWLEQRKDRGYPKSTWNSDLQRYRDYVSPLIGSFAVCKINSLQIRTVLREVTDRHKLSINTRNHVRALLSTLFNDAMNEPKPLCSSNPALNISFQDPRMGTKEPKHIRREVDIIGFLKAAKELSPKHLAYASIMLMTGLRKQEIIALRWNDFNEEQCELTVDEKFIQAEMRIVPGTKKGADEARTVVIPDDLVKVLEKWKKKSDYQGDLDFILTREDGNCIPPREMSTFHNEIRKTSGIDITPHGLRHTYGRQFALKSGNIQALQAILGHSSHATTELYSRLAGKTVNKLRNTVSFKIKDENE